MHHILYCNTFLDVSPAPELATNAGKNPESILDQTKGYSRLREESFYKLFQTPQVFHGNTIGRSKNGPFWASEKNSLELIKYK
jgi:hypothetical protein